MGEWKVHFKGDGGLVKSQISLKSMMRTINGGDQAVLIELNSLDLPLQHEGEKVNWVDECPLEIRTVIRQFDQVLAEKLALPPERARDHGIELELEVGARNASSRSRATK